MFLWLSYSIYRQIQNHADLDQSWDIFQDSFKGKGVWKILFVLVLMLANWGIEAKKWQLLVIRVQSITYLRSYRAIFSGQAFALNSINKTGDFVGRILYLEEGNRLRAISLTLVGSMSQMLVTFAIGFVALLGLRFTLLENHALLQGLSAFWLDALLIGLLPIVILIIIFYYNVALFIRWLEKIPFISKYKFFIEKLDTLEHKELTRILLLSASRYVVVIVQYVLLLQVFGANASVLELSMLVAVFFILLAMVPTIAWAELGLRGKLSLLLFGLVTSNQVAIIAATVGIWVINLIVPAILGSLLLLGLKLFKQKENID